MNKARKQTEPSAASLREIPEADFRKGTWGRRPHIAARIAAEGMVLPGRGRPRKGKGAGPSTPRSIRFPDRFWKLIENKAKAKGLSVHAALRAAILEWVGR